MKFQYEQYLLALAAIPLMAGLYLLALRWKKKTIRKIGDERLVKEMTGNYSAQRFALKFIIVVAAFAAGAFGLANLRSSKGSEKVNRNGIDVMIALDVSKSMMAQDIKPNRLERAKQLLGKLIDKLSNDRIGIVIFAGKAYLQMPLTGDHGAAKLFLSSATPDAVPTQGTVIGDALKMCFVSFNAKEKKYKSVILISDGEDHDEKAGGIATQMAEEGVVINTIGIGSPAGAPIVDPTTNDFKKDNEGNTVITKLNEDELRSIAQKGNGIYQLFTNTDDVVNRLDAQLSSMDQRTVTEDSLVNYENFFQYFLALALLLLVIEMFIPERVKPAKPLQVALKKPVFLLLLLLLCSNGFAQSDKEIIKKANELYSKAEYEKAAAEYKKVTDKTPANAVAQYNLGNALYKNAKAKPEEAVKAYDNALSNAATPADKAKAYYNKGVVLQNNKKLPECIDAYKNALKIDPNDEDARQNLQKAIVQLKQQQKQQQQNKNDKDKQQQKDNQQKKDQQKQPDKQDQDDQPKPQPSKLSKQEAEEKLKALLQQEKNLQDRLRKVSQSTISKPEKDW